MEERALGQRLRELFPGAELLSAQALGPDASSGPAAKAFGYGRPIKVTFRDESGERRTVVFRTAGKDDFGHDRRADRAAALLLDFDCFPGIPQHVAPLDVGAIGADGQLISVARAGEFYLVTTWAEGTLYSEDLRRIAENGRCTSLDLSRCQALARYLAELHAQRPGSRAAYRRAIRDLVGHGEGVFGVVDGYPDDTPNAPAERLERIERLCWEWRWKLRGREQRLARTHGDFHPFNVVVGSSGALVFLDASRGCQGDPADDVCAMAINYLLFGVDRPGSWREGFSSLWHGFWREYLERSGDAEVLVVAPPFFAWRALVVCNPRFYPDLSARGRDALLTLAERALAQGQLSVGGLAESFE